MKRKRLLLHKYLCSLLEHLPTDYWPWGEVPDDDRGPDCSCGCDWFVELEMDPDMGICGNPESPRFKLLTFEHQSGLGCFQKGVVQLSKRTDAEIAYVVRRWIAAREKLAR